MQQILHSEYHDANNIAAHISAVHVCRLLLHAAGLADDIYHKMPHSSRTAATLSQDTIPLVTKNVLPGSCYPLVAALSAINQVDRCELSLVCLFLLRFFHQTIGVYSSKLGPAACDMITDCELHVKVNLMKTQYQWRPWDAHAGPRRTWRDPAMLHQH